LGAAAAFTATSVFGGTDESGALPQPARVSTATARPVADKRKLFLMILFLFVLMRVDGCCRCRDAPPEGAAAS
jgi:hypothetical protein